MRIVFVSDTHGKHFHLDIPKCDLFVHAGDISSIGTFSEVYDFLYWLTKNVPAKYKVFIAGNHDLMAQRNKVIFDSLLRDFYVNIEGSGLHYLEDSAIQVEGINIWGSPWTPSFYPDHWVFNADRGEKIAKKWSQIPNNTDILITHGPPYETLDTIAQDKGNFGCQDLLEKVKEIKPKIHAFGHLHNDGGKMIKTGGTTYINCAVLDDRYYLSHDPVVIETDIL